MDQQPNLPPIGAVLKQADQVITEFTNKKLAKVEFDRLSWQILNTIKDGGTTVDSVAERLSMFADSTRVQSVVDRFKQQGWVEGDDELKVTESGEQKFQQVAAMQNGVRDALMQTISQDEYVQIVTVLQRMIRGLS